jgi:hypothetical protein
MAGVVGLALLAARAGAQGNVTAKEPGGVFFAGEAARFTAKGTGKRVTVQVVDYDGRTAKQGVFPANAIDLGILPRGSYLLQVTAPDGATRQMPFVVVPRPHPRPAGRIAADAALSWLVPANRYEEGAELLRRSGVRWVRDRLAWGEIAPTPGKYVWGRYDRAADAQSKRGLQITQVFHTIPAWARADGATNRFPDDLRDVYRFAKAAAQHFRGRVKAWEVWNEADIPAFSIDPGCEYAAFLKAAYLGFKAGDAGLPITQVSFALASERFGESLMENGAAAYYDIFNYHIYDDPGRYAARAAVHERLLARSGVPGRPIWLTEAGIPLQAVNAALTPEDQRRQAEFISKSCVESLAHGTDRHFFFILPYYLENGVAFGALDADGSALPGYAALATVADALGAANYIREIRFRQPGLHLHLFDNGEGETLAAWSDTPGVTFPLSPGPSAKRAAKAQVLNVVGAPLTLEADAQGALPLPLSPSPIYVLLPRGTMAEADTPRSRPSPMQKAASPPIYGLRSIIVRLRLPDAKTDKEAQAYRLPAGRPAKLEAQIYNFGGSAFTGTALLTPPDGWKLERSELTVTGLPPMGRQVETLTLTPDAGGKDRRLLRGVPRRADGEQGSPAVVDIFAE